MLSLQVKTQTGIESRYRDKQSKAEHSTTQRLDYVVLNDLESEIEVLQQKIDIEKVRRDNSCETLRRKILKQRDVAARVSVIGSFYLSLLVCSLQWLQAVHHATEEFLGKRSVQLQDQAKDWEQKHSEKTAEKDKELEQLKNQHQRDVVKLKASSR